MKKKRKTKRKKSKSKIKLGKTIKSNSKPMLLIVMIILLIIFSAVSIVDSAVPDTNWYDVENWELEVCSKTGGFAGPQHTISGSAYFSKLAVTIQAKATLLPDKRFLYEVGYYIKPLGGEVIDYEVKLFNNVTKIEKIVIPLIQGVPGGGDFNPFYDDQLYTHARISYTQVGVQSGAISVPIILKEEYDDIESETEI